MLVRFLLLLLVVSPALICQASADTIQLEAGRESYDLNAKVDVLEDVTGNLSLAEVSAESAASAFKQSQAGLSSFGFTDSAYWFCFRIDNPVPETRKMLLVLRSAWLDTVNVYQADGALEQIGDTYGDTLPFRHRQHVHPQFLLDLRITPGQHVYYLRLTSKQAFMTPMQLWEPEAFYARDRLWAGYFGMFYGVLLVMVLYNACIWFSTRDRNYLFYCLYLTAFFVMNFSYNGFSFQYFWPESPRWTNWSYSSWIFLYQATAVLFAMHFLESRSRLPKMHSLLKTFLSGLIAWWLLVLVSGKELLYNASAVYFVFFFTPLMSIAGITAWFSGYKAARFFALASMANLLGAFITALTVSGFLTYSFVHFHAVEFGIVVDVVLLALALADRINLLRDQKEAAEKGIIEQKIQANALLEMAKENLECTVLERTMALAQARDHAEHLARIDVLTEVSNRRYFEEVAVHEFARARRYQQPLSVIMFDIDFFKKINDTYGHAAGDRVLKIVASAAKESVREVDFVARIGGEEFAILLPGVVAEQALVTAERLRERIAEQNLDYNGWLVTFTASFGVAQALEEDELFEALLQRADQSMYWAKKTGRNQVRSFLQLLAGTQ